EQRATLDPLLAELRSLGVRGDAAFLDGLTPRAAAAASPTAPAAPLLDLHTLDGQALALLARMLAREPAALTARLLSLHARPWQDSVLAQFDAAMREAVERARDGLVANAPALDTALRHAARLSLQRELVDKASDIQPHPAPLAVARVSGAGAAAPDARGAQRQRRRAAVSSFVRGAAKSARWVCALIRRARPGVAISSRIAGSARSVSGPISRSADQ
ncbi:MAG TPA: hypothetical protein VLJ86_23475, partial [Ramlibacter sp.]|nr:hypothetical protein [Ramlibacter sp.]